MKAVTPPRSPFASSSWEPRFVVESWGPTALSLAVELWRNSEYLPADALVHRIARHPDYLLVAHPRYGGRFRFAWTDLPAPLPLGEVARLVAGELTALTYPPEPNFDGAEAAGFCAFSAYFAATEVDNAAYGALIVLPKWIELHK